MLWRTCFSEHDLHADGPSSTVALARWDDVNLDCLVLGDSPIAVMHSDGHVDVITDRRLSAIGADKRAAYRERLVAGGGFDSEHRELLRSLQAEQRKYRNEPDGFWIAADDPSAADHALTRRFPVGSVSAAVLMTDGASAIVDRFGLTTWADMPSRLSREGCAQVLAEIDQAESADPAGRDVAPEQEPRRQDRRSCRPPVTSEPLSHCWSAWVSVGVKPQLRLGRAGQRWLLSKLPGSRWSKASVLFCGRNRPEPRQSSLRLLKCFTVVPLLLTCTCCRQCGHFHFLASDGCGFLGFLPEGFLPTPFTKALQSAQAESLMLKPLIGFRFLHLMQNCVIGSPMQQLSSASGDSSCVHEYLSPIARSSIGLRAPNRCSTIMLPWR